MVVGAGMGTEIGEVCLQMESKTPLTQVRLHQRVIIIIGYRVLSEP